MNPKLAYRLYTKKIIRFSGRIALYRDCKISYNKKIQMAYDELLKLEEDAITACTKSQMLEVQKFNEIHRKLNWKLNIVTKKHELKIKTTHVKQIYIQNRLRDLRRSLIDINDGIGKYCNNKAMKYVQKCRAADLNFNNQYPWFRNTVAFL